MELKAATCWNHSLNDMKEKQAKQLKAATCWNHSLNKMKEMQKKDSSK